MVRAHTHNMMKNSRCFILAYSSSSSSSSSSTRLVSSSIRPCRHFNTKNPVNSIQLDQSKAELTVGIEIHAQLNTPRKLFSPAASTIDSPANTHVAFFDLAIPGTQPIFQKETLIPAIRAALALNCKIQETSSFDRKHYFHWDLPLGYQITQYYQPYAKDGYITLYKHDGIAPEDGDEITVGIKQIHMEQDTAKTVAHRRDPDVHLIDYNRVGTPLIEIVTLPQIHHPATAAALVKKVQTLLKSVDACVLGMESGGLRADVNVSIKPVNDFPEVQKACTNTYAGITNLGCRTEIKNLSSLRAVEAAIEAERDRQISVMASGGVVESETRGWTLGFKETKSLRKKEGEVDYRYMPDADIPPVRIGTDLIAYLKSTMGVLPDEEIAQLTTGYGLTTKDALSLYSLENGARLAYFYQVIEDLTSLDASAAQKEADAVESGDKPPPDAESKRKWGKITGNWVLHELGGLLSTTHLNLAEHIATHINEPLITAFGEDHTPLHPIDWPPVPTRALAEVIYHLSAKRILGQAAKFFVNLIFHEPSLIQPRAPDAVKDLITKYGLWFDPLSDEEYAELARSVIEAEAEAWEAMLTERPRKGKAAAGKLPFFVGCMIRVGKDKGFAGRVEGDRALKVLGAAADAERKRRGLGGEEGG